MWQTVEMRWPWDASGTFMRASATKTLHNNLGSLRNSDCTSLIGIGERKFSLRYVFTADLVKGPPPLLGWRGSVKKKTEA